MNKICTMLLLSAVASSCMPTSQTNEVVSPNVLFISIDDLNDWEGSMMGHTQAITPNMDRLFESGVLFTNAHCSQAVCTASRNSVLSGIHPSSSGWYTNGAAMKKNYDEVMADHKMLPEYFKDQGYHTYATGKVFHNGESDFSDRTGDFWTEYAPRFWNDMDEKIEKTGYGYRGKMFFPFPKDGGQMVQLYGEDTINNFYRQNNRFYSLAGGPLSDDEIPENGMYDEQIADWAIEKISKKQDKPFFMAVGFIRPHVPYTAPQKYFDLYNIDSVHVPVVPDNEFEDIPIMGKAIAYGYTPRGGWGDVSQRQEILPELVHAYLACVSFVDDQVGRVLEALENSPNADNTIIVLWSDHGQHLGEKRHFRKQALWEEATRVPLFFRVPGNQHVGHQSKQVVSLLDIYPTLAELCGLPVPKKLEGESLVSLLDNPKLNKDKPVLTTWLYKNHAVRSNDWRYILYRDGGEELYHHGTDPGEHTNLAFDPQYAQVIAEHKKWLPAHDALPAGETEWKGDNLDRLVEEWTVNDTMPDWLK
ncbi:sulfatase [Reichenbachiella agarivorans]|uniref:Sulfatase n=1 Tax=Reichenbachiella agarivorans TaxID=2979464 RepID=A0ABY6CTN2_9BACT|nr:sulfatase [Reichenbachiella agarivorans]UXP33881.1 sulfatase [Reichenbachiella agarivorans]